MSATLIGVLVSAGVTVLGYFLKWKLSQAREDRLRRKIAEADAQAMSKTQKANGEANAAHEGNVIEIMRGVDDSRAGELLSRGPKSPKISRSASAKNGSGARPK